jgi:hypothetical protein
MKELKTDRPTYFCRLCDEPAGEDQWCEGCAEFICTACDQRQFLPIEHEPEEHKVDSL